MAEPQDGRKSLASNLDGREQDTGEREGARGKDHGMASTWLCAQDGLHAIGPSQRIGMRALLENGTFRLPDVPSVRHALPSRAAPPSLPVDPLQSPCPHGTRDDVRGRET